MTVAFYFYFTFLGLEVFTQQLFQDSMNDLRLLRAKIFFPVLRCVVSDTRCIGRCCTNLIPLAF